MKTIFNFRIPGPLKLFSFCFLFFSLNLNSQFLNWQWAKAVGGELNYGKNCATDAHGNVYLTGQFTGHYYILGSIILSNTVWNGSTSDFFIVKYDGSGNVLWAKSAGGNGDEVAKSISSDADGNIYVTGTFKSATATFGSFTITNSDTSGTTEDIFIAAYDISGDVIWAKSAGGSLDDEVTSLATDTSGDVFISGYFLSPSINFGSQTLTNYCSAGNCKDIFIVKYHTDGNAIWTRRSNGYGTVTSFATDADGNVYLTGNFTGSSITFGYLVLSNSIGGSGFFIVKYFNDGHDGWGYGFGGDDFMTGSSVSVDGNGNVFVVGNFYDYGFTLNTVSVLNHNTSSGYTSDIFIAKYNPAGILQWLKEIQGGLEDDATSTTVDPNGDLYITGYFDSPVIHFDNDSISFPFVNPYYYSEFFIAKYNTYGNEVWAKTVDGSGYGSNTGMSTTSDSNGNIYVTGSYGYPISFGFTTLSGSNYRFLAKLSNVLGVEETNPENTNQVFPNPFTESTTIQFSETLRDAEFDLYDISGQKIKTIKTISGNELKIDREDLSAGIYFFTISKDGKNISEGKMIVTD